MKKIISLVLALALCLSLFACGASGETPQALETEEQVVSVENEVSEQDEDAEEYQTINFEEPILISNDDTVKIEMLAFYEEYYNWGDRDPAVEKGITFRFTNNTEDEVQINLYNAYLDGNSAWYMYADSTPCPAPGKATTNSLIFREVVGNQEAPLASIDDLYRVEGEFQVINFSTGKMYEVSFSIPELMGSAQPEQETVDVNKIGDMVSTDMVEFTLDGFDFVYYLDPGNHSEKEDMSGGALGPGEGNVFANPEFTVTNIAKNAIDVNTSVVFTVVYADGYEFGLEDGKISYLVESPSISWKYSGHSVLTGSGYGTSMQPLETEDYDIYIPASDRIDTDTASQLLLVVTLESATGTKDFTYQIR